MTDRSDWKDWMVPIIRRALERGESEDVFVAKHLLVKRDMVRRLYREMREQMQKAAA